MLVAYSPFGNGHSIAPFGEVFDRHVPLNYMGNERPDALLLWGGQDVHPSYYGEVRHKFSQADAKPTERDKFEWKAMMWAKGNKIPIIGVCRGAQFINVFAGGKLVQHCSGHHKDHLVVCEDGEMFPITSSHHQMLRIEGTDGRLLAWSHERRSTFYVNGDDEGVHVEHEPEIVFYPGIKALAIQGHPEWVDKKTRFVGKVCEYINKLLLNTKARQEAANV